MQNPNVLLTILGKMALKPEVKFDNLYPKLYNTDLWLLAYEKIAPKPGNMTPGVDGQTIDGMGLELVRDLVAQLKTARYVPTPVRRVYREKANGKLRPLGIPSFADKLLQTVVKLILEAIYEPTFSDLSHGFRPGRSCHTALASIKNTRGIRWWVEGDIHSFFDTLQHDVLLRILNRRITDKRFLHLIKQFLKAGYIEDWKYHQTYSGTPQGANLSPLLSNIFLNELDQAMALKITEFNRGPVRRRRAADYNALSLRKGKAKKEARITGDWSQYKTLRQQLLNMAATDPLDPDYRRMHYWRFADDFLIGVAGSKADAVAIKSWLTEYLSTQLQLELSSEKTLITNAKERVRFLGYDIMRWTGRRVLRYRTTLGVRTQRTTTLHLALLMPRDKVQAFARTYGNPQQWRGEHRTELLHLSELEIVEIYNAEIRGFLGYYALADNLTKVAGSILWMTTTSFLRTLAAKRQSTLMKVARSLKTGPAQYTVFERKKDGTTKAHRLVASTRQLKQDQAPYERVDIKPNTWIYRSRSELGQRLAANQCEWCSTQEGQMQVHHVRKLSNLKGKAPWEIQMIARRRKTMVLCKRCHVELHAGRLSAEKKAKGKPESRMPENGPVRFGGEFSET